MLGPNAAALRSANFSTACWSCTIKQRRQLRHLSSFRSTSPSSVHEPPSLNSSKSPFPTHGLPLSSEKWAQIEQEASRVRALREANALKKKVRRWRRIIRTPFSKIPTTASAGEVPLFRLCHSKEEEPRISFRKASGTELGTKLETKEDSERKLVIKSRSSSGPSITYHLCALRHRKVPFNKPEENLWDLLELHSSKLRSNDGSRTQEVPNKSGSIVEPHSKVPESLGKTRPALSKRGEAVLYPKRSFHSSRVCPQHTTSSSPSTSTSPSPPIDILSKRELPIREQLQQWQEKHGTLNSDLLSSFENHPQLRDVKNDLARIGSSEANNNQAYEDDETEEYESFGDLDTAALYLQPGDLTEVILASRETTLAVYIRDIGTQSQFYTMAGSYLCRSKNSVHFVIPGFIDRSLVDEILPYLPTAELTPELINRAVNSDIDVPRGVGGPILTKLLDLWRESEKVYRDNASVLDGAYDTLTNSKHSYSMTLEAITEKLLGSQGAGPERFAPTPATLFAVRKALHHAGFGVWSDTRNQRITSLYKIRVRNEAEAIELVRDWIRDYQEHLGQNEASVSTQSKELRPGQYSHGAALVAKFLDKARQLISVSRQMREPTKSGCVGPSKRRFPITESAGCIRKFKDQEFTDADRLIISFLESWTLSQKFRNLPQFLAVGPTILRAVGCYEGHDHTIGTAFMFLQEIGVLLPYENKMAYDEALMLPTSRPSHEVEETNTKIHLLSKDPGFHDSMADMRVKWTGHTIFCVDDVSAMEIDDGVSITRVEGKANSQAEYWVHIHVANPTAFFDKSHLLARTAADMVETVYMPERAYPMLPQWLSNEHFSVASGRPVITFSARLDSAGYIKETKIQHGIAQKVVNITPGILAHYLDIPEDEEVRVTVGGVPPTKFRTSRRIANKLPADQVKDLIDLNMLANARRQNRKKSGGLFFEMTQAEVAVYERQSHAGLGWSRASHDRAQFVDGDPIIELRAQPFVNWFDERTRKNIMVQEMMLLACEIGASWCAERNIPLLYRGTVRKSSNTSAERFEREVLEHANNADGVTPMHVGIEYLNKFAGQTLPSTTPIPHGVLGLPHYAKVTSPLRRYGDMVTHWQIESVLREEAKTGRSLVGSRESGSLAFHKQEIAKLMTTLIPQERIISRAKYNSLRFWNSLFYLRAHSFGEYPLPETFKVIVTKVRSKISHSCISTEWSVEFNMVFPETQGLPAAKVGDCWEARLARIDVYFFYKELVPIRLISREVEG
ncbi:RNB-domain-containing protein [Glonium stellatum]|uniref:RNB-domain-containing protein n=1 Tax=Glonium stellatum TaxID=574774 RepID=A0A8E2FCP3_9PEZI|nr:RNB-domain-containing protein [Glonium stellatum]